MPGSANLPDAPCLSLDQYIVGDLRGLHYIPDYLSSAQQKSLLESICSSKSSWTQVVEAPVSDHAVCMRQRAGWIKCCP